MTFPSMPERRLRALVISDDLGEAQGLCHQLRQAGCRTTTGFGTGALETIVGLFKPNLVFVGTRLQRAPGNVIGLVQAVAQPEWRTTVVHLHESPLAGDPVPGDVLDLPAPLAPERLAAILQQQRATLAATFLSDLTVRPGGLGRLQQL